MSETGKCEGELYIHESMEHPYSEGGEYVNNLHVCETCGFQIESTNDLSGSIHYAPAPSLTAEDVARIEDALYKIDEWAKAYPEDVFPRPDLKKAEKLLKDGGVSFSALNASSMNHVIQRVKQIIDGSGIRAALRAPVQDDRAFFEEWSRGPYPDSDPASYIEGFTKACRARLARDQNGETT